MLSTEPLLQDGNTHQFSSAHSIRLFVNYLTDQIILLANIIRIKLKYHIIMSFSEIHVKF